MPVASHGNEAKGKFSNVKSSSYADACYKWRGQGRIKRSRGPGQLALMSSFSTKLGEESKKKDHHHVRRCPIFCPKSGENQK